MRAVFATLAFAALAAAAHTSSSSRPAGAVTSDVSPPNAPPAGCSPNYDGSFQIGPVNITSRKRQANTDTLGITLKNGVLTDDQGRTGYVASNQQFQFDDPPQAGAIWTSGFTVCPNNTLALGPTAIWYKCLSGSFYNLYYKNELGAGQCIQSFLITVPVGDSTGPLPVPKSFSAGVANMTSSAAPSSSGPPAHNGTMSVSASASASGTATTTRGGGGGGGGGSGGGSGGGNGGGNGGSGGGGGGSGGNQAAQTSASASASATSKGGASDPVALKGDIFGLAAGLLAFALF